MEEGRNVLRKTVGAGVLVTMVLFLPPLVLPEVPAPRAQKMLINLDETWPHFKGTEEPTAECNRVDFDDQSWLPGDMPIGQGEHLLPRASLLDDKRGNYVTVSFRKFEVDCGVDGTAGALPVRLLDSCQ